MTIKVAIQCTSLGQRCGIYTYSKRLEKYLNNVKDVDAYLFAEVARGNPDIISLQYESGLVPPQLLDKLLRKYTQPIVVTAHHIGLLPRYYSILDGIVFHCPSQIVGPEPWNNYTIIKHPAIVYPEKGKENMRKKYKLPLDKKIVGTAGFIAGTGKNLPKMVDYLLKNLQDDEFLYCITSFWKGGDFGFERDIREIVKKYGKENQFRIDTDFVSEEVLNEKMQTCDLLFSWNSSNQPGSSSGMAMDMIGSRRKVIVKDSPHYQAAASIDYVEKGRKNQEDFAEDVLNLLRTGDLDKVPDPTPYSWESLIGKYVDYFKEMLGE